ncbi:MAG TPA: hypothetical protein VMH36_28870 [Alphaproteobacteria bacterium]|nr:hypothetical protein [Alphaproteobacteria bacterium]
MKKYVAGPMDKKSSAGFWGRDMDSRDLAAQRQFLEQLNLSVAVANREVIHQQIPNLNKETFQQLAVMVAKFRANYLEAAIKLSGSPGSCDSECLADLRRKRELYDEGRAAFEALERAIERGYVDIGK